jgi:hypothetical protein
MSSHDHGRKAHVATLTPLPSPSANPRKLNFNDLGVILGELFASPCIKKYGVYFYLNTLRWRPLIDATTGAKVREGFEDAAGEAIGNPGLFNFHRQADPADVTLTVQYMTGISGQAAFNNNQPLRLLPAVFVELDNVGCFVPFDTGALISACFIKGLVTRLVLGLYVPIWKNYAPNKVLPIAFEDLSPTHLRGAVPTHAHLRGSAPTGGTPAANMESWIATQLTALASNFVLPSTWNGTPTNTALYSQCVMERTDPSLQLAGILMGWRAGDALVAATGTTDGENAKTQIWRLIGYRYTTKEVGKMMGYVFMVLSGFLNNDRTNNVINYNSTSPLPNPPENTPGSLPTLFSQFGNQLFMTRQSNKPNVIQEFVDRFYQLIEGEFYGIVENSAFVDPGDALMSYHAFMVGFVRGTVASADQLFDELYNEGYQAGYQNGYESGLQIGYTNGFRDGYSQGFAGGYTVGYQNGDAAGFSAGSSSMGGLGNIINGISGVLGSASSILSDAGTVGTVISTVANLFAL